MKSLNALPWVLLLLFSVSVTLLFVAMMQKWVHIAEICVVLSLLIAVLIFLACSVSAILHAINRYDTYWRSGYPFTIAATIFSYGAISGPAAGSTILLALVLLGIGIALGGMLPKNSDRFISVVAGGLFLFIGEYGSGDLKFIVMPVMAGVVTAFIIRSRSMRLAS